MIHVKPPFDADAHRYLRPDGRPYGGSVTGTIKAAGLFSDAFFTDFGRERGTYVHTLTELYDQADLDESTVDVALAPYLAAWVRFKLDYKFIVSTVGGEYAIERRYGDDTIDIAGTVDRIGFVGTKLAVVDLKSGAYMPWHPVQLAAYADFASRSGEFDEGQRFARYGVYLTSDGKYEARQYTDRADLKVWQAAVTIAQWKRAHLKEAA
jgi:hypothetical protein